MEVERSSSPAFASVMVDENAIVDCVQNLIDNAVKYASGGGWIRVRAENAPRETEPMCGFRSRIMGRASIPKICRISSILLPRRSGPQFADSGRRAGLSLVSRIVEAHDGTVDVRSSAEAGAAFFIDLPRDQPAAPFRQSRRSKRWRHKLAYPAG